MAAKVMAPVEVSMEYSSRVRPSSSRQKSQSPSGETAREVTFSLTRGVPLERMLRAPPVPRE